MHQHYLAAVGIVAMFCGACNNNAPEPASVDIPSAQAQLTIIRAATDPFLSRHSLTLKVERAGGCSSSTELFPNTGYASRRNLYQAGAGMLYVVGQFDARVIDVPHCTVTLEEFRALDRYVTFLGSFDENEQKLWTYFPASQRSELAFEKR